MKNKNFLIKYSLLVVSLLMASGLFFASCKKSDDTPDPALAITSISPASGKAGDVITINGTGFDGTTATNNTVKFGTTGATVLAATPTTLVVKVPDGITGNFSVTVDRTGKTTATSPAQFSVTTTIAKTVVAVSAPITADVTWTSDKTYLISNFVYVRSGVTVTIQPGTIIKGDKLSKGALIFEPGSKINAQGTADNPIVFTSNLAPGLRNLGDWGGLVLCGKADHNAATGVTDPAKLPVVEGGPTTQVSAIDGQRNNADNSGVLSYVRIEWAGVALSPNNEINGLSLYAVGSGTKIDHIQVSFANDDSIEWFGGTVNMKYLVAWRGIDDDFDTDNGFSGRVQFGVGVRDLTIADQSGSKGFESDNDANNSSNLPQTACVFSNMTLVGPTAVIQSTTTPAANVVGKTTVNPNGAAPSASFVSGIHIRRNSALSTFNSIILGWPAGVLIDANTTAANIASGKLVLKNNIVGGNLTGTVNGLSNINRDILYLSAPGAGSLTAINALGPDSSAFGAAVGPITYWNSNGNKRLRFTDDFQLTNPFEAPALFDVTPKTGSPALTTAPSYTDGKLVDAFFDKTPTFVGAVGGTTTNFLKENWVKLDVQNIVYQ